MILLVLAKGYCCCSRNFIPDVFHQVRHNREQEINLIEHALSREGAGVLLIGPSGSGKTSLAQYLTSQLYFFHSDMDRWHGQLITGCDLIDLWMGRKVIGEFVKTPYSTDILRIAIDGLVTKELNNLLNGEGLNILPDLLRTLEKIEVRVELILTGIPVGNRLSELMELVPELADWQLIKWEVSLPEEARPILK